MESDKVRILVIFKQKKKVFVSQSNENTFFALSKSVKFSLVFRHNRARFSADQKRGSGLELPKECSLVFYYQENLLVSILSSLLETRTQFSERPKVTT